MELGIRRNPPGKGGIRKEELDMEEGRIPPGKGL
jgi:hypothetical protein